MNRFFYILLLSLLCGSGLRAQPFEIVYPGDANNNGVVNNVDFLYLGLGYNYIGPARENVAPNGFGFSPQSAESWTSQFASGVNVAHADCNGDGIVNYFQDAFPLYFNYGQRRPDSVVADVFVPGIAGIDPDVHFDAASLPPAIGGGQQIGLPIWVGDAQHPVEDLYGLAFSVFVDPAYVDAAAVDFDFTETSWANPDNDRVYLHKTVSDERIDVAWTRTDHNQLDGFGRIGTMNFIIIIDVVGIEQDFEMRIDSIKMVDKWGNETTVAGDTLTVHLSPDSAVVSEDEPAPATRLNLLPNPAGRSLRVEHSSVIRQLILSNVLGQPVLQISPERQTVELDLPPLPEGIYLLEIRSAEGTFIRTVQIRQ